MMQPATSQLDMMVWVCSHGGSPPPAVLQVVRQIHDHGCINRAVHLEPWHGRLGDRVTVTWWAGPVLPASD